MHRADFLLGIFSTAVGIMVMVAFWPFLDGHLHYDEFVVGPSTFADGQKGRDAQVFWGFLGVFGFCFVVVRFLFGLLLKRSGFSAETLQYALHINLLLLLPWLSTCLVKAPDTWPEGFILGAGCLTLIAVVFLIAGKGRGRFVTRDHIRGVVFGLLCGYFSGLGLVTLASMLFPGLMREHLWMARILALLPMLLALLSLSTGIMLANTEKYSHYLHHWLLLTQVAMPLLVVVVLPERLFYQGEWLALRVNSVLVLMIVFFVLIAWISFLKRYVKDFLDFGHLSYWSIASIAIFFAAGAPHYPSLSQDHFHFGEMILPWMQWAAFGKVPFVDFFPFHGWMHLATGFVNATFFGDGIAGFEDAEHLIFAVSAALTAVLVARLSGSALGIFTAVFFLPATFYAGRLVLLPPAMLVLAQPDIIRKPVCWLIMWLVSSLLLGLYNTVSGASFVLGTSPFALWNVMRAWSRERKALVLLVTCGALLSLFALISPAGRMFSGYISFILENRPSYMIVQGRSWADSFELSAFTDGLFSLTIWHELFRNIWVVYLIICLCGLIALATRRRRTHCQFDAIYMLAGVFFLLIFMSSYSLGRIDTATAGRQGTLSYLLFSFWLPVVLVKQFKLDRVTVVSLLFILAGPMVAMMNIRAPWDAKAAYWRSLRFLDVPAGYDKLSDLSPNHPLTGVFVSEREKQKIATFDETLKKVLPDNEGYLDLTSKQAFYVYANRPVPVTHGAVANIDNTVKIDRVVDQIKARPPSAVWIHPRLIYDVDVNLRSYDLYRHVMLNYDPVLVHEYVFMVNHQSPAFGSRLKGQAKMDALRDTFPMNDFQYLPSVWGRSWSSLSTSAIKVTELSINARDDSALSLWSLQTAHDNRGSDADLLVLEIDGGSKADEGIVNFKSDGQSLSCSFNLSAGVLVIPVGVLPDWLLSEDLSEIMVELPEHSRLLAASLWLRESGKAPGD